MKTENERFSVACLRCPQNLKFGDFTPSLCRGPQRYLLNSTIIYALLTNDIIVLCRCRSRSRRRFLNSLIPPATQAKDTEASNVFETRKEPEVNISQA